jgi:succinylglutamic semialdehyde dehydrogenase
MTLSSTGRGGAGGLSALPRGDYIDGSFRIPKAPDDELVVSSPADLDDEVARHPVDFTHVDAAVDAARRAWPGFRRMARAEREALLRRYQQAVEARREVFAEVIAREVGKPIWEARAEVNAVLAKVDVTLGEGARLVATTEIPNLPGRVEHRPLGVLAVVGPFNFPAHLPNGQIVPALALGNTVVFKPSEKAPSAGSLLAECVDEAGFPPGVFNVVHGALATSSKLVAHEGIDGVLFTGSYAVGRAIAQANAHRPERLVALELGGKNAALVDASADLERTARQLAFAAYATAGQRCTATSVAYVHRAVFEPLLERIAEAARALRVGHVLDARTFMGPVVSAPARARILDAFTAAEAGGYEAVVHGGATEVSGHRGYYLRPALHRAERADLVVQGYTDEELFGPDLAVHPIDDLEQGVALANRSRYGLAASVFTAERARFEAAAAELDAGVVHWNRSSAGATGRLPFGGVKRSGNHRPGGLAMSLSCSYPQGLYLEPDPAAPPPSWPGLFGDTEG